MKNTKLIKLIKTFSPSEFKKFGDFVNSPYFNKNKNIIKLNNELKKYFPKFDNEHLTEELIYKKVFGSGGKFDYFKIKNIISDLYNLGLGFLKQRPNIATSFAPDFNLLAELRSRKLMTMHKKFVLYYEKKFAGEKIKDGFHLFNEYLLVTEKHLSIMLEKPTNIDLIKDEFNSFHDYVIINLLKLYSLMLHISKENRTTAKLKMFDEVYSYIEKNDLGNNPVINIYKYIILLTVNRNVEHYFKLKEEYLKNFNNLSKEEAYYTHMYIFGFCMDRFNVNADRAFIRECYDLFIHAYNENLVSLGELLYPDFINFIKVFMRQKDKELAEKFINEYKHQLPLEQLENCINFSNAYIAHFDGRFNEALALVTKVNFPLLIMKVQVKIMQIQLNFQLGYFEETREQIEYFRKSLAREENISADYKASILGFLKLTIMLINIVQSTDKKSTEFEKRSLLSELAENHANHFGIKFWLQDRLNELEKII
ncbi:MAG: hypothetical protein ABI543_06145 [Ignavibacteria bacterium]